LRLIWRSDTTQTGHIAATVAVVLIYLTWIAGLKLVM
jgi:hypothetical protein